MIFQTYLSFR